MSERLDRNCLSHWFPILRDAGLPAPKTEIVRSPDLRGLLDGQTPEGYDEFLAELLAACHRVGTPTFLRTGQGSGKHGWKRTCCVKDVEQLPSHVFALVEWSEMVDFFGLSSWVWCAREMLPTVPLMHAYDGMPVVREFRCFVKDSEVVCAHPYWPQRSLEEGFPPVPDPAGPPGLLTPRVPLAQRKYLLPEGFEEKYERLCTLTPREESAVYRLASRAGDALGGCWSVDVLDTRLGWFVTDVALAHQSYHWDGCDKAALFAEVLG